MGIMHSDMHKNLKHLDGKPLVIDGHDMQQVAGALEKARSAQDHPTMIIAKTIKGYGVDRVENKEGFHGKAFSQKELDEILPQFEQRFASAAANGNSFNWQPIVPGNRKPFESFDKLRMNRE